MFSHPKRVEVDHHTIKLVVGVIAISLATLTSYFSDTPIQSISASYHENGWPRDIFVGFLFAISAFLLAYHGRSSVELMLGKIAAIAAMGVAMFPCKCVDHVEIIPHVHGVSAAVLFVILAIFCYLFYLRAKIKGYTQAKLRATVYVICGLVIVASILIIAVDHFLTGAISSKISRLTFIGEAAGLVSFGIAWLTASRMLLIITNIEERLSLSPFSDERRIKGTDD
jgi:hypothetical protein